MRRGSVALLALSGLALALRERRRRTPRRRVEIGFADGSRITLEAGAHAEGLLDAARSALAVGRP